MFPFTSLAPSVGHVRNSLLISWTPPLTWAAYQVGSLSQEWALLSHTFLTLPYQCVLHWHKEFSHYLLCLLLIWNVMPRLPYRNFTSPTCESHPFMCLSFSERVHKELPQLSYLKVKAFRRSEKGRGRERLLPTKAGWCSPARSAGGWGSSQTCWPQELWLPLAPGDLDYLQLTTSAFCWTAVLENLHLSHL